jgi:hypothetical protein
MDYAGRTVRMEYRLTDGQDSAWANRFLDSAQTERLGRADFAYFGQRRGFQAPT